MKRLIAPLIFGAVGTAILLWLGFWQVERLQWKQAILADIDARIVAAPVGLPDSADPTEHRYLPVEVAGEVLEEEIRVLASLRTVGPVYRIIRVVETDDGRRILADMGYVRDGQQGNDRPGGRSVLLGNLYWPDELNNSTPEPDEAAEIWFARDVPIMAEALETEEVMIVLREPSDLNMAVTPFPVDSSAIPNDHLSYAVTWFLLAITWMGMTLFLVWRISKRTI